MPANSKLSPMRCSGLIRITSSPWINWKTEVAPEKPKVVAALNASWLSPSTSPDETLVTVISGSVKSPFVNATKAKSTMVPSLLKN